MTTEENVEALKTKYAGAQDLAGRFYGLYGQKRIEIWHAHVFTGLVICAVGAQKHLRRSFEERDVSYVSWAARNLLELGIWCRFCENEANAQRFHQDSMRDLSGTMVAYRELMTTMTPTEQQKKLIDDTQASTAELSAELGVFAADHKFLAVSDAADYLGKGTWFRKTNKILSKMVHPTAYLVATGLTDRLSQGACENFSLAGVAYAELVYDSIDAFARSLEIPDKDASSTYVS